MPNMQNRPNSNPRNQQGNKNAGGQGTGFAGFQQGGKPVQDNKKKTEQAERTQPVRRPPPEKPFPTMGNSSLEALSKGSDKNKKKQSVCPPSKN